MSDNPGKKRKTVDENTKVLQMTEEEIEIFREDYREKEREIQRNIGIYLSGLVLVTGWLIGPQTKPLIKMALDNYAFNLFGFLVVAALNVIFTCFLIYKSLIIHEIMQFIVVNSPRDSPLNYWEAWRRSSQSATKKGAVRFLYNSMVLTVLPLFVSIGILLPLGLLIHCGNPQYLAEQLKNHDAVSTAASAVKASETSSENPQRSEQLAPSGENTTMPPAATGISTNAEQISRVFNLVKYFFWGTVLLHAFPLWFVYQNLGPVNKRWGIINSKQVSPHIYDKLLEVPKKDSNKTRKGSDDTAVEKTSE